MKKVSSFATFTDSRDSCIIPRVVAAQFLDKTPRYFFEKWTVRSEIFMHYGLVSL